MSDRQLSLTDVMLGLERLSLHNILTPANFRFFWGLIMIGNRLNPRFKNPFDVTVNQAIGAGGGESRQAVNRRQHSLKKIKIDGQWLIKIKAGSKINNRPALYEINFNLIVPSHVAAPMFERQPSQKQDGLDDGYDDGVQDGLDDDNRTILREEKRRRDKTTSEDLSLATTQGGSETDQEVVVSSPSAVQESDFVLTTKSDVRIIEGLILNGYRTQIMDRPPAQNKIRAALEIYDVNQLTDAIDRMPDILQPKNPKTVLDGDYVLSLACVAAKNPHLWRNGEDGGNGGSDMAEQLDLWHMALNTLEIRLQELKDAGMIDDPRNEAWLKFNLPKMDRLRGLISENGGAK